MLITQFYCFSQLSSYNPLEFHYNGHAFAGIWAQLSEPKSGDLTTELNLQDLCLSIWMNGWKLENSFQVTKLLIPALAL